MDYLSLIKRISFAFIVVLLLSCRGQQSIFSSLALVHTGLDFPFTQEKLTLCRKTNDEPCLRVYKRVKNAKKLLFSRSREKALKLTIDTISKECVNSQSNLVCIGAITALYFFPTLQDDISIRNFLNNTSSDVLKHVTSNGASWLNNRENKLVWRDWIVPSRLSIEDQKKFLIFLDMQTNNNLTINHLDDPE